MDAFFIKIVKSSTNCFLFKYKFAVSSLADEMPYRKRFEGYLKQVLRYDTYKGSATDALTRIFL
jgi:hypothetical protein